jgi:hypothetical protein
LNVHVAAGKFRDFDEFPAEVLNFQQKFRNSAGTASRLRSGAIFQQNFLKAGCRGGNPGDFRNFRRC